MSLHGTANFDFTFGTYPGIVQGVVWLGYGQWYGKRCGDAVGLVRYGFGLGLDLVCMRCETMNFDWACGTEF